MLLGKHREVFRIAALPPWLHSGMSGFCSILGLPSKVTVHHRSKSDQAFLRKSSSYLQNPHWFFSGQHLNQQLNDDMWLN